MHPRRTSLCLVLGAALVCGVGWGADASAAPAGIMGTAMPPGALGAVEGPRAVRSPVAVPEQPPVDRGAPFQRLAEQSVEESGLRDGLAAWQARLPATRQIEITSTLDGTPQRALMLPPRGDGAAPLLVVLHTWGGSYAQSLGIPFARFAAERGWALVQPDFRGPGNRPDAGGSDLAVQDVVDAIEAMVRRPDVDAQRVYVVGFSGGGHMGLLLAGRHPDKVAGVVTWGAVHDLVDWYRFVTREQPSEARRLDLLDVCGGDPETDPAARTSCGERSPQTYLTAATRAGLPMYVAAGLQDRLVPPSHTLEAFEQLTPEPSFLPEELEQVRRGELPGRLRVLGAQTYFDAERDPEVLFATTQGPATVVLFEGEHSLVYNPGLAWLVDLDAPQQERAERRATLVDLVERDRRPMLPESFGQDVTGQAAEDAAERLLRERSGSEPT